MTRALIMAVLATVLALPVHAAQAGSQQRRCPHGADACLERLIADMQRNLDRLGCSHDAAFALLYLRTTESIRDAIIVADAHTGRIALWNTAAESIFGYSRAEAQGMSVEELIPDYLKARYRAGMAGYRKTGHGSYIDTSTVLDLPAVSKTGEEIRVELTLSPIEPVAGAAIHVTAWCRRGECEI